MITNKSKTDQNYLINLPQTTPRINGLNSIFQGDFSEIIEEEPMSQMPKISNTAYSQKQRKLRNNSPQKSEMASQINIFTTQGVEDIKNEQDNPLISNFFDKKDNYQNLQISGLTPMKSNLDLTTIFQDQDKSQVGLTLCTEDQPLQIQQQQQQLQQQQQHKSILQNRKTTAQSIKLNQNNGKKSNQISGYRNSTKDQASPFEKYMQASIQMGCIAENSQATSINQQVMYNRQSANKDVTEAPQQQQPGGKIAKYLKQFMIKKKNAQVKRLESNTSKHNHQEIANRLPTLNRVSTKVRNIVSKAATQWKEYSTTWMQSQLSENAYVIIGDKAHLTQKQLSQSESFNLSSISKRSKSLHKKMISIYKLNKRKVQTCFQQLLNAWKSIKTIDPSSTILLYWDIVHILCIIFNIYYIIIEWVTEINFSSRYGMPWIISIIVSLSVFGVDMILNFHKGFYSEGLCIFDKWRIAKFYMTKNFYFDACAIVPLIVSLQEYQGFIKILAVLILLKLQTVNYLLSKYKDLYSSQSSGSNTSPIIYLTKLALTILFVAHIFASLFLGLAIYVQNNYHSESTWITQRGLTHDSWLIQYIFSFYWAVCTMTTVGYGDITPQNPYEAGYVILTMFLACGFFAYTFNTIGQMVQEIQNRSKEFNEVNKQFQRIFENNKLCVLTSYLFYFFSK